MGVSIENEFIISPEPVIDVYFEQEVKLALSRYWLSRVKQKRLDIERLYVTGRLSLGELDYAQDYYDDRVRGYVATVEAYEAFLLEHHFKQN